MSTHERAEETNQRWHAPGALRLWFTFDNLQVQLVRISPLQKRPPPSDPVVELKEYDRLDGAWIELRNEDGRAIWRQMLHNPFAKTLEAPKPGGGFANAMVDHPRGTFTVLTPDLLEARSVAVFANDEDPRERRRPAVQIAEFPLRKRG